jgi:hypothetical protein
MQDRGLDFHGADDAIPLTWTELGEVIRQLAVELLNESCRDEVDAEDLQLFLGGTSTFRASMN